MRKIFTIMAFVAVCCTSHAQIKSFSAAKPIIKEKEHKITYDSTTNFVGKNAEALVGQELYIIPQPENEQKYGYTSFYTDYEKTESNTAYTETYELYAGKTYIVEEVLPRAKDNSGVKIFGQEFPVLKLKEKDSDKIYYFVFENDSPKGLPFVIMGFYEKEKKRCVGKQIVIKKDKNPWETNFKEKEVPMYDVRTGLEVKIDPNIPWTVQEFIIDQDHGTLAYLVTNDKGETLTIRSTDINDYRRRTGPSVLWYDDNLKEIHAKKQKQYNDIMKCEVSVGMTQDMVLFSWGAPKKKSESSYSDSWFYDAGQILIFRKGILESFIGR
jgi:hypothetical protein